MDDKEWVPTKQFRTLIERFINLLEYPIDSCERNFEAGLEYKGDTKKFKESV